MSEPKIELMDVDDVEEEKVDENDGKVFEQKERVTTRYMTKYERARVLGTRALQIRYVFFYFETYPVNIMCGIIHQLCVCDHLVIVKFIFKNRARTKTV